MDVEIRELTRRNLQDFAGCDSTFDVRERLVLRVQNGELSYTVVPVPEEYEKSYNADKIEVETYLDQPERRIYLAYAEGRVVGRVVLMKFWNGYGYIDHLSVVPTYRRCGIGRRLVAQAVEWAKGLGLPGLMLETQDDNLPAVCFYERCGFRLGGFDRFLYKALKPDTEEVALYFYKFF